MIQFSSLPELSLYIHLPWCIRKCPYCDFNSHELRNEIPEAAYIDALIADLESSLALIWGRPVISIFLGGGTPSLFSEASIDRLLSEVRARIHLLPGAEITLEANPGTFEAQRFSGFARAGINRISLGVQSFNNEKLVALGRVHDSDQARRAAEHAVQTFPEVNLDLMYGLPGQTLDELAKDLATALSFQSTHLSLYQLTLEPNTAFAARPPSGRHALPDQDLAFEMQQLLIQQTQAAGLERYEISAYARPGHRCQHNLNYWTFGDYLGIGAGAHSKLSTQQQIVRQVRWRHPRDYMMQAARGQAVEVEQPVASDALPFEFMLNALRLMEGVPVARWAQTTGTAIGDHPELLTRLGQAQRKGLLSSDPRRWQATPQGIDFLNDLQELFL
jgi:putative oxygen-independent coproporphyrinogen III oxidase